MPLQAWTVSAFLTRSHSVACKQIAPLLSLVGTATMLLSHWPVKGANQLQKRIAGAHPGTHTLLLLLLVT